MGEEYETQEKVRSGLRTLVCGALLATAAYVAYKTSPDCKDYMDNAYDVARTACKETKYFIEDTVDDATSDNIFERTAKRVQRKIQRSMED